MDKVAPKSDMFKANCDRVAPLLANLKTDGIGHIIEGNIVPSISGDTFQTKSPVDGTVLASVARGLQALARHAGGHAKEIAAPGCGRY
jgi:5-carboxymethyl-2-hydroxymuconic-semialdehyde dehydrogenase